MHHLIFDRFGLSRFFLVENAKGDREAWEAVKRANPEIAHEIGSFPPQPGDDYDLIDVRAIQAPADLARV